MDESLAEKQRARIHELTLEIEQLKKQLHEVSKTDADAEAPEDIVPNLQLSEQWMQIAHHTPMGVHIYELFPEQDGPGRLVFQGANPAADRLMGVDNRQFVGKTIETAFPPLALTEVPERYRRAARDGVPWRTEQVDYSEGEIVGAFEVHAFQTRSNQMAAMFWNITERKQTEKKLHENEQRLRQLTDIIDRSVDLISTSTPNGVIQYMNPAGLKLLGWDHQVDLLKRNIPHAHPQWAFEKIKNEAIPEAVAKGVWQGETAILHSDESEIPVFQTIMAHKDPKTGEFSYLSTIMRDISENRKSEQEIQRLQQSLTDILNSMPSIIISVDDSQHITHWNLRAEETWGKAAETVLGRKLLDVSDNLKRHAHLITDAIQHKTPQSRTNVKVEHENETRFIDLTVFPLSNNGAVIRIDDVTDKVRMEELLIQTEKMQSVGGLAAGMAHEINNPLAAVLQNLQVLKSRLTADLPQNLEAANRCNISIEALQQYLEERKIYLMLDRIHEAGSRASILVSNMLSFSRQNTRGAIASNISELMAKTIELVKNDFNLSRNYDFRKIQIVQNIDTPLPPVMCEPNKIQQVFLNLITNSAHAMKEHTYTENLHPCLHIDIHPWKDHAGVDIAITDNGTGMEDAITRRIFEPFFTTKPVGQGTGLGLAICYFIITQQHGGQMFVESTPGAGTTFRIQLPTGFKSAE